MENRKFYSKIEKQMQATLKEIFFVPTPFIHADDQILTIRQIYFLTASSLSQNLYINPSPVEYQTYAQRTMIAQKQQTLSFD